jgi:hypothetical protein
MEDFNPLEQDLRPLIIQDVEMHPYVLAAEKLIDCARLLGMPEEQLKMYELEILRQVIGTIADHEDALLQLEDTRRKLCAQFTKSHQAS